MNPAASGHRFVSFWHGAELSVFENACLESFTSSGFEVSVFSYSRGLQLPPGCRLCDARALYPEKDVFSYSENQSVSAFSNLVRYKLLSESSCTWIDLDVFLLNPSILGEFDAGWQNPTKVNGAVLASRPSTRHVFGQLLEQASDTRLRERHGSLGPDLLSRNLPDLRDAGMRIGPSSHFYPIPWNRIYLILLPEYRELCENLCRDSCALHLFNEYLRVIHYPKCLLPPRDSYLDILFSRVPSGKTNCPRASAESVRKWHRDHFDALSYRSCMAGWTPRKAGRAPLSVAARALQLTWNHLRDRRGGERDFPEP
jgi:hypothetical protein